MSHEDISWRYHSNWICFLYLQQCPHEKVPDLFQIFFHPLESLDLILFGDVGLPVTGNLRGSGRQGGRVTHRSLPCSGFPLQGGDGDADVGVLLSEVFPALKVPWKVNELSYVFT